MKLFLALILSLSAWADKVPNSDVANWYEEIHGNGLYTTEQYSTASRRAKYFEYDTNTLPKLAERTNVAIKALVKISILNLKRHHYYTLANELSEAWEKEDGLLQEIVEEQERRGRYDIGDFEPLLKFLGDAYTKIEQALGYDICYVLRLTDLKTLVWGIPVVFEPCRYGQTEFGIHMCSDPPKPQAYKGVFPVVAYWTSTITCSMATFGAGLFFICSPVSMLVEIAVKDGICPWAAPKLYNMACSKE
jgi:hypothetical protein